MYDELPLWSAPFGLSLLDKFIPFKGSTVLDIGFGTGFPLTELAMRLGSHGRVTGIDPDPRALEITLRKLKEFGIENADLLLSTAEEMPLPDHAFDWIVSNNGLNNTHDPGRAFLQCHRVLKPGGRMLFTMNLEGTMMEFYSIMEQVFELYELKENVNHMRRHIHQKRMPVGELIPLLKSSGFKAVNIEESRFCYRFSDSHAFFHHHFIRQAFLPSWDSLLPDPLKEKLLNNISQRIDRAASQEGTFNLTVPYILIDTINN